jgi:hypothetical protein
VTSVFGSDKADYIVANSTGTTIKGGAGDDTIIGGAGVDTVTGGTGRDLLTGGDGADTFIFATSAVTSDSKAGADVNAAKIEKITDFVVADDTIQLGLGAGAFGTAVTFTTSTVMNVDTAITLATADYADLDAVMAAVQSASGGTATDATTAQAIVFTVVADSSTGSDFDSNSAGTYLAINDATAAWGASDAIFDITGLTGTIAAGNFDFVA